MAEGAKIAVRIPNVPGYTHNVDLDLEARGLLARDTSAKPLRWKRKR